MKADWKTPKLNRNKRLNDLQRLQQRVAELEQQVVYVKKEKKFYKDIAVTAGEQWKQAFEEKVLFNALLQTEVMVPTKDGFKLLTGDSLREYCEELDRKHQGESLKMGIPEMVDLMFADAYIAHKQNHDNTRSQSQESDQEDAR